MASWEVAVIGGLASVSLILLYASRSLGENFDNKIDVLMYLVKFALVIFALVFALSIPLVSVDIINANNGTNWATVNESLTTSPYTNLNVSMATAAQIMTWVIIFIVAIIAMWLVISLVMSVMKKGNG